jgi:hypothetical protein
MRTFINVASQPASLRMLLSRKVGRSPDFHGSPESVGLSPDQLAELRRKPVIPGPAFDAADS